MENKRDGFGSNFGFLMVTIGSAVGLGNLWGFPYKMGANGGFAFLLLYLVLLVFVGFSLTLSEVAVGRKFGKGVISAYEGIHPRMKTAGYLVYATPLINLGLYFVIAGYCMRYVIAAFGDMIGAGFGTRGIDPSEFFSTNVVSSPWTAAAYSLVFIVLTVLILSGGVSGGLEKFSKYAMPLLFFLLIALIIKANTLPNAIEGIKFMFTPDWSAFADGKWIHVLSVAGSQMFFSISVGFGAMMTCGSFLSKKERVVRNSLLIPGADTLIAIMGGLCVMPAVFAMGIEPSGGAGLLFISLQTVFNDMGAIGPYFAFMFYLLASIAAMTSCTAALEVPTTALIDYRASRGKTTNRKKILAMHAGIVGILALVTSLDCLGGGGLPQPLGLCWLDFLDFLSEGLLMPINTLILSLVVGWYCKDAWLAEEIELEGNTWKTKKFNMFCMKFIAPILIVFVLLGQIDSFFGLGWF